MKMDIVDNRTQQIFAIISALHKFCLNLLFTIRIHRPLT